MKESKFRLWLQEMYYLNSEEHEIFHEPKFSIQEYFNKYKYWLKREYRFQKLNK